MGAHPPSQVGKTSYISPKKCGHFSGVYFSRCETPRSTVYVSNNLLGQWLNLKLFWDYIFSRENKVQSFFFRVHWLSETNTPHNMNSSSEIVRRSFPILLSWTLRCSGFGPEMGCFGPRKLGKKPQTKSMDRRFPPPKKKRGLNRGQYITNPNNALL